MAGMLGPFSKICQPGRGARVESRLVTRSQSTAISSFAVNAGFAAGHDMTPKLEIMGHVGVQILLGKYAKEPRSNP